MKIYVGALHHSDDFIYSAVERDLSLNSSEIRALWKASSTKEFKDFFSDRISPEVADRLVSEVNAQDFRPTTHCPLESCPYPRSHADTVRVDLSFSAREYLNLFDQWKLCERIHSASANGCLYRRLEHLLPSHIFRSKEAFQEAKAVFKKNLIRPLALADLVDLAEGRRVTDGVTLCYHKVGDFLSGDGYTVIAMGDEELISHFPPGAMVPRRAEDGRGIYRSE